MAQRVTLRTRKSYNTTSNRRRVVKTPGGKLVYHHLKKLGTAPKCGDCGVGLSGVRSFWLSVDGLLILLCWCSIRSLLSAPVSTPPSPSARRQFPAPTVAQDAVTASSPGEYRRTGRFWLYGLSSLRISILRAFLVEEAKIVKKVIKSQQKTAAARK